MERKNLLSNASISVGELAHFRAIESLYRKHVGTDSNIRDRFDFMLEKICPIADRFNLQSWRVLFTQIKATIVLMQELQTKAVIEIEAPDEDAQFQNLDSSQYPVTLMKISNGRVKELISEYADCDEFMTNLMFNVYHMYDHVVTKKMTYEVFEQFGGFETYEELINQAIDENIANWIQSMVEAEGPSEDEDIENNEGGDSIEQ